MTAITGHRGARALWPENSLGGFRNAVALGCDAIEFDVHLSDAGELLVIHDPLLDRTTEGTGEVRALSPEARRALRLKDSTDTIPTLDEVLDVLGPVDGLALDVEIKLDAQGKPYAGLPEKVAALLRTRGLSARSHLTSFDFDVLRACQAAAPEIRRLVSADARWIERRGGLDPFIAEARSLVDIVALRHDYLAATWEAVTALWPVADLCAWTVNDAATIDAWLARGIGHLTSDDPKLALARREAIGASGPDLDGHQA